MLRMSSHEGSSSEDEAPEAVSFQTAKNENIEQLQRVKEQINSIRESQKKRRIERQEKYIEQKKKKFDNLMLAEDVLDAIEDEDEDNQGDEGQGSGAESAAKRRRQKRQTNTVKKFDEDAEDLDETTFSDFVPLKTYAKYGVSVVNLASTGKKPLIASDKAKAFKSLMHNRGIRRQSAREQLAMAQKRKFVKYQS